MREENAENIVYSKSVIEFATVANEYCNFIETQQSYELRPFLSTLQKLLPLLYLKTSMIPALPDDDAETPDKYLTEVDYTFLLNKLTAKLGSNDSYLEVFDPGMQFSETPIESSISENLCDIYQDLKDFVFAYRMGTTEIMSDAIWECKKNFEEFWGQKLVNGMRAIHALLYSDTLLDDDKGYFPQDEPVHKKGWVSNHFSNKTGGEDFTDDDL
jgi:hypothetical protein